MSSIPYWNIDESQLATATIESISEDLRHTEQFKLENELKFRLQERQKLPVFIY
jgi:hypothetical protein